MEQTYKEKSIVRKFAAIAGFVLLWVASGWAGTEKVLVNFGGSGNPALSVGTNLISDGKGNFYGLSTQGGASSNSVGTAFKLSPQPGGGWKLTVIHSFGVAADDGDFPNGSLLRDNNGNLYGTTNGGGKNGTGIVFELVRAASGWNEHVLYTFGPYNTGDGAYPQCSLVMDKSGNLYGTTVGGGSDLHGTVFELSPQAGGTWKETILHSFSGTDGSHPAEGVIPDSSGNLYGTTSSGGASNLGTVYKVTRLKSGWAERVLLSFAAADGSPFHVVLLPDASGNLYGTSVGGGTNNTGAVWEIIYSPTTKRYSHKTIYSFGVGGGGDGENPAAGLTFGPGGVLYGTTIVGGIVNISCKTGCGTVFDLAKSKGGTWTEAVLYRFTEGLDGGTVHSNVIEDQHGNAYGITELGGSNGAGVVFKVTP